MFQILFCSASVVYQRIISAAVRLIEPSATVTVSQTAAEILTAVKNSANELIILDLSMPDLVAVDIIDGIKRTNRFAHIVLMSGNERSSRVQLTSAIEKGVLHFFSKPIEEGYDENLSKIKKELLTVFSKLKARNRLANTGFTGDVMTNSEPFDLMLVASSTGGPVALETLFMGLPADFPIPVLIVQHMPANFTKNLAANLAKKTGQSVAEAKHGDFILPCGILIAPGGYHMRIGPDYRVLLDEKPLVNGVRPSADVLFKSVADVMRGKKILSVILTGMGSDGTEGVRQLKRSCFCHCITQSENSCIVYGMPRSVVDCGLSDRSLDLVEIPRTITRLLMAR